MPSNLNALLIAWAASLIIIGGTTLFFEITHDPSAPQTHDVASPQNSGETNTGPAAAHTGPAGSVNTATPAEDPTEDIAQPGAPVEQAHDSDMATAEPQLQTPPTEAQASHPQQDMDTGLTSVPPTPAPEQAQTVASLQAGIRVEALPGLLEQSNQGPLPRVSRDGQRPLDAYAAPKPSRPDSRPKIALVITELGMRARSTRRAIADLPSAVTFAFSPYASNLMDWGEQSRRTGHEVMLMIPMEPVNYPQSDPGPLALLTSRSARENINILKSSLGRLTGYVGVINHMGSRFTAASESLRPVLEELHRRGLMFVDSRASQYSLAASMARDLGMPASFSNRFIDISPNAGEIAKQLADLESRARVYDYAVGLGRPYPVTIDAVKVWAANLEDRGFVLVPISATANEQPLPR